MRSTQTMTSQCVDKIRKLILAGELLPGDKIKGEYLRNVLGVGLSPIREALSRLATTPLVEFTDNAGFKVGEISIDSLTDSYTGYAKIEALLLSDAILNGDDAWEARIIAALYRLTKIEKNLQKVRYGDWNVLNKEFHDALVAGCRIRSLQNIRKDFILLRDWYFNLAFPNLDEELFITNHTEHQELADLAIMRKDPNKVAQVLYEHTLSILPEVLTRIQKRGLVANKQ